MEVKVFVMPGCPKCPAAKAMAKKVAERCGLRYVEVDVSTPDGEVEGLMCGVVSTPSIAIGEEVVVRGDLLTEEELEREVLRRLKER